MQNLLEVDSVIKSYGHAQILTDIYLKCRQGDIIGMLGRNGTGKSTLLKIIFGTLMAENKFVRINHQVYGKPYTKPGTIQYLPQEGFLPANSTVRKIAGLYFNRDESDEILDDDVLRNVLNTRISELSGGEGRYFEIKLLLFSKSKFLLLDEPFNGIAPILIDSIKKMITQQAGTKGIVLTDHDYRNVIDVANRIVLLYDGGIKNIENEEDLIGFGYIPESGRSKI